MLTANLFLFYKQRRLVINENFYVSFEIGRVVLNMYIKHIRNYILCGKAVNKDKDITNSREILPHRYVQ